MAVLASPIMMTVMKSMVRRPYLSPKWPKMAPPMRAEQEADGERTHGGQQPGDLVVRGEEQRPEHDGGSGAVEEEVIPVDDGANGAGQRCPPSCLGTDDDGWVVQGAHGGTPRCSKCGN